MISDICVWFVYIPGSLWNFKGFLWLCPEIVLLFAGQRRSSAGPDRALQEALRTRLRVVESNSQDVIQLFKVSNSQRGGFSGHTVGPMING